MTFRKLPPLGMLRAFEAAARHISFARAGTELGVTAAAVSQQVKALEDYLGQALFLRRPQGLSLTEAGLSYLTILRDAFDRLGAGTEELFHGRSASHVSVRVTAGFAHLWLAPRLHRFLKVEPGIRLRLLTALWTPLEIDREADFEIRCGIGAWPQLTAHALTRDRLFPLGGLTIGKLGPRSWSFPRAASSPISAPMRAFRSPSSSTRPRPSSRSS